MTGSATFDSGGGGDGKLEVADNWVLATVDSWVRSGLPKDDVIGKIMSSVSLPELRDAASILRKGGKAKWGVEVGVPQEGNPEYSRNLAGAVYKGLLSIQNLKRSRVAFWINSTDLLKVPGARQHLEDQLDGQAVAARLAGVDAQMDLMLEKLKATEQLQMHVVELAETVTELKAELKESQRLNQQYSGQLKEAAGAVEKAATLFEKAAPREAPVPVQSYAERVAGSLRQSRVRTLQTQASRNSRSTSSKRGASDDDLEQNVSQRPRMELEELRKARAARSNHFAPPHSALSQSLELARDGFQEVKKKRRGTVAKGSSTVQADGGEKPPYSVFLSGTSTNTDEELVKEKLGACYAALKSNAENENDLPGEELKVLKVDLIPLKIPVGETPRSKCWKVTVAPEFAVHMARAEAYPQAWGWRRWNPGPRAAPGKTSAVDGGA